MTKGKFDQKLSSAADRHNSNQQETKSSNEKMIMEQNKRQLLKMRLQKRKKTSSANTTESIPARTRLQNGQPQNNCPASFAQQRIWLVDQLDNDAQVSAYHISGAFELTGEPNLQALQKALDTLVARHEILRTRFVQDEQSGIRQTIETGFRFPLRHESIDLASAGQTSGKIPPKLLSKLVDKEIQEKFDLGQLPLARGTLYRFNAMHHLLVYTMHHIVGDAWSMGVLFSEVASLYRSYISGKPVQLPELKIQYSDYAIWQQQQRLASPQGLNSDLAYWQQQLQDAPSLLSLPCDYIRPPQQSFRGKRQNIEFDRQTTEKLTAFCQQHDMTPFALLHACWSLLLSKLSGQNSVVVGVPTSNRSHKELEALIGFFINTLPLHIDVQPQTTRNDFLQQVKQQIIDGFSHQNAAFEDIVNHIQPDRNLGHHPVFQAMFVLRTTPHKLVELDGISMTGLDAEMDSEQFDLTLALTEVDGGITGYISYSTDLFAPETIARWSEYYRHLMQQMVQDQNPKLCELQLLNKQQQQSLLSQATALRKTPVKAIYQSQLLSKCNDVVALFERSAQEYPDAPALEFYGVVLSYTELNQKANKLANLLLAKGQQSCGIVGICLPRSLDMYIAVLATLKAGLSYAPLVPTLPKARIATLSQKLANNQKMQVLTSTAMAEVFAEPLQPLCLDDSSVINSIAQQSEQVSVSIAPEDSCYVLATSGSTGEPKLIDMPHKALVALIYGMQDHAPILAQTSRYLQFSTLGFDMSFTDMMLAWSSGGCLLAIEQNMQFDLHSLSQFIAKKQVEVMNLPAAVLQQLAEMPTEYPQLKCVISTAEALHITEPLKQFFTRHHKCQLLNHYGPTETHVVTAYCFPPVESWLDHVPMGEPLKHVECFILDEYSHLVAPGCVGELCISGVALANGYLHNPEQTEERFISHPLPQCLADGQLEQKQSEHHKLYRTGDLVRKHNDGRLEYIGRADHQVKIRGYRIEIGEIESCIGGLDNVLRNMVVLHEPSSGIKQLVAYVQLEKEQALLDESGSQSVREDERIAKDFIEAQIIEAHLKGHLPDYMVPKHIIIVSDWSLTANGKVDRKKLPSPQSGLQNNRYCPASSATEKQLLSIWSALLGQSESDISADADFFALGGHSLLAVQMISRINEHFGLSLTIRHAFLHPSIKMMAVYLDNEQQQQSFTAIEPAPRDQAIALSFAQKRLWFIDKMQGHSSNYHIFMALQIDGAFHLEFAEKALKQVIQRHEILRTCYRETGDGPVQVITDVAHWQLEQQDLQGLSEQQQQQEARELMENSAARPFDLSQDYMLRALYLNLCSDKQKGFLLLTMHHIASDGWSMNILADEFATFYGALLKNSDSYLVAQDTINGQNVSAVPNLELLEVYTPQEMRSPLEIQYADFSVWQAQQFSANGLEKQLSYWQENLHDAPAVHGLPLDHDRPQTPGLTAQLYQEKLDLSTAHKLEAIARQQGMTLFMLLHGIFALLLSRHSGMQDIVVGTPVAGRNRRDLEGLIGFFVNTLILRVDVTKHRGLTDYLQQIKQLNQQAQANQDVPFDWLVEHLNVPRELSHAPLFQIMFSYNTIEGAQLNWPGVDVSQLELTTAPAKFDLDVSLNWQRDGVQCNWLFDDSLFTLKSIAKYAGHFINLLQAVARSYEQFQRGDIQPTLESLNMFSADEAQWLINHSAPEHFSQYDSGNLCQRFTQQVQRNCDSIALICDDHELTYNALNRQANQLAQYLIQEGVQPGDIVAICNQRSISMIVQLLAVLKVGGSYLPLDPESPAARFASLLKKSKPRLVLTSERFAQESCTQEESVQQGVTLVVTDSVEFMACLDGFSVAEPVVHLDKSSIAYVMFTSGTTGEPKGVRVTHDGILRLVCDTQYIKASGFQRILHNSNVAFDAATLEIWLALLNGKTCVINAGLAYDHQRINQLIRQHHIDALFLTSGLFDVWSHDCAGLSGLKWILTGGDVLSAAAVDRVHAQLSNCQIVNCYGPTENTVVATAKTLQRNIAPDPYNIGRAINDSFTFVLAPDRSLSPVGASGELCVAGNGLAAGYLDLPEITAQKFIFSELLGQTLYKTGDMVRFSTSGDILFLGRCDNQIKLRGFRIELSEIELALQSLSLVEEAMVLLHQEQNQKHLVAFVKGCDASQQAQLKHAISDVLPPHMRPELLQIVPEFPITQNGKFDRNALLASLDVSELNRSGEAIIDEAELALAQIWQSLLRVEQVYRHDNFFDIGGHSLLVVRLLVSIREKMAVDLDVRQVFEQPTLCGLSAVIVEKQQREELATSIEAYAEEELERFEF